MQSEDIFDITGIVVPLIPYCDKESPEYHPELDKALTGEPPYNFDNISINELNTLKKDLLLVWLAETNLGTNHLIISILNDVIQALPRVMPVTDEEKDRKRSFENNEAFLKKFGSAEQTSSGKVPQPASATPAAAAASSAPTPSAHVANAFLPPKKPQSSDKPSSTTPKLKK